MEQFGNVYEKKSDIELCKGEGQKCDASVTVGGGGGGEDISKRDVIYGTPLIALLANCFTEISSGKQKKSAKCKNKQASDQIEHKMLRLIVGMQMY